MTTAEELQAILDEPLTEALKAAADILTSEASTAPVMKLEDLANYRGED